MYYWSFSEFLNLIELRSQTWCIADLRSSGGFHIPRSEAVLFYAVLEGSTRLSIGIGPSEVLSAGDIVIIISGEAHAIRSSTCRTAVKLDLVANGEYLDEPASLVTGVGAHECRLLCGRLKPRWPGGKRPSGSPRMLRTTVADSCVDVARLVDLAGSSGGSALLTRMATLIFINAFRDDTTSQAIFNTFGLSEPIARAVRFIETHPFTNWTVANLANKVGMSRSNFATRFVADVGKTPMAYVAAERMKHASAFLEQTDMKVAEIADRVGYRSLAAFSHRFVAHFGMTPGELRNRKRESAPRSH